MEIKNIKVGMVVKNYKELCELVGVKVRNGSQKKKQLEDFKRYFECDKLGQSFLITKVYSKPRAFTEEEMIELLLLHLLVTNENDNQYVLITTKRNMYEKLKMVNLNYKYCVNNPEQVAVYKNIPEKIILDNTNSMDRTLENKLIKTLNNLSDRKILVSMDVYMISHFDNNSSKHQIATDEEIQLCVGIEGDVLKELGYSSQTEAKFRGREKEYISRVKEELKKHDIKIFYRAIKIIFIEKRVPELIRKFEQTVRKYKLSKKNCAKYVDEINKQMQIQMKNNIDNRIKKAQLEVVELIQKIEEINNKIAINEYKPSGFSRNRTLIIKGSEEELAKDYYDLEKCQDRLEVLKMRLDKEYLHHAERLIELIIENNTVMCIEEIRKSYNKNNQN
jgi:hypothetical protein